MQRAFLSQDGEFARLKSLLDRKFKRLVERDYRRPGPVLRVNDQFRRAIAKAREAVIAARPSSRTGRRARRVALDNLEFAHRIRMIERRAVVAAAAGKRRRARTLFKQFPSLERDLDRTDRKAKALFRQARREAS